MTVWDVAVIGGGAAGLSAGWHLALAGQRVVVLEADKPGSLAGSSHGRARMTRSTYGSRLYVELVAEALGHDWPQLQAHAEHALLHPWPAVFFGPRGGLFDAFCEATMAAGCDGLSELTVADAQARFPMLRIEAGDGVVLDETAGVLSADHTLRALQSALEEAGGVLQTGARVVSVEHVEHSRIAILGREAPILARHVVVAAGAYTPALVPEVGGIIRPLRQVVGFAGEGELSGCPNWARLDRGGLAYGLPPHGGDGAKMARHRLTGPADELGPQPLVSAQQRAQLLSDVAPALTRLPALQRVETCLYAATASEDPVLSQLRGGRVTVLAGLSGHGFKLAPLLGRIAADVVLGRPSVPVFEAQRARFGVSR